MTDPDPAGLDPGQIADAFLVRAVQTEGDHVYYIGEPQIPRNVLVEVVGPRFREAGYDVHHMTRGGRDILVAMPRRSTHGGIPWTNVALFVLTVVSTLFAGAMWYHVDVFADPTAIWQGWPFATAILTVLGVHELGHYVMARYHGVDATLPYFIPVPTIIGTMGAVIKMNGHMPDRRALFDIGIAGPLAGLIATVVVTAIGLTLDPVTAPESVVAAENAVEVEIGWPPLMEAIAWAMGAQLSYADPHTAVNPVVIGGWVGMFVTFLNMLPVGQLDGGHIVRAMSREYAETIGAAVPGVMFGLVGILYFGADVAFQNVSVWFLWGLLGIVLAYFGSAQPLDDREAIGPRRRMLAVLTFGLAVLCFAPVPIAIVG